MSGGGGGGGKPQNTFQLNADNDSREVPNWRLWSPCFLLVHIPKSSIKSVEVPTSLQVMFAGMILVLFSFNYESSRRLIKRGKVEHATANLSRVRYTPEDK